jgi:tRNA(Glu) U13 pseudouridine synthase TruD
MEAVNNLARYMHLPVKTFSYAGTKDKRAVTVQVCINLQLCFSLLTN